jgi:uncharacterized protein (DUF2141 family)
MLVKILLLYIIMATQPVPATDEFVITFTNVEKASGSIYVGIYDRSDHFLKDDKAVIKKIVPVRSTGEVRVSLAALPPGTYAVSAFHDVNGNGRMDKNIVGIPTEPYGFSNDARPMFRAPNWNEAKFAWKGGTGGISVRLEKW